MLPISRELAQRLEYAEAADGAACVEGHTYHDPASEVALKPVGGGYLLFLGMGSPLTHALGIGMQGAVSAEELDEIEKFFKSRGSPVHIDLSPYADWSLRELLGERHYRVAEFQNVMAREVSPGDQFPRPSPPLATRPAEADECEVYAATITRGFFGRDDLTDEEFMAGRQIFRMPQATPHFALCEDEAIGGGSVSIRKRVASLFGDATLVAFRGRGAHQALIRARLALAAAGGCDLATAGTQPGSVSQRNFERCGFQVAYTKITMVLA